jgi:hypothetical protein
MVFMADVLGICSGHAMQLVRGFDGWLRAGDSSSRHWLASAP